MKKKYVWMLHLLFWGYFFGTPLINFNYDVLQFELLPSYYKSYWFFPVLNVIVFYFNYLFVLPHFYKKTAGLRVLGSIVISYTVFILLRYSVEQILFLSLFGEANYDLTLPFHFYIYDNLFYGAKPIFASTIIWLLVNFSNSQQEKIALIEERKEAEINFLKSQVNPHFIFNTLNNIYYLVYQKSDKSLAAIEKLSSLMRYVTYESKNDLIAIQDEVQYIHNFIELESMRISGIPQISFKHTIQDRRVQIPPLLLIPFIENGFKHGVLTDPDQPLIIELHQNEKEMRLFIQNKTNHHYKDEQGGVGIENIKRRLELYYPDKHQLKIQNNNDLFSCHLTIEL